jgi:hypothetical protein
MCKKEDCPIYDTCDKEQEQAVYCRKIELLLHLSKVGRLSRPRSNFVPLPVARQFM